MKTRRRIALGACVACVVAGVGFGVPSALFAVPAKGKVVNTQKLLNLVWNEAKDAKSNRYYFMEPASTVPSDVRVLRGHLQKELCVAITGDAAPPPRPGPWSVKVEGGRTSPVTFVVGPGEQIEFANKDPWDHMLYAVDDKAGFGDATLKSGQARTWTPPGPGKYELRDKLFPSVRSWIVVSDKPVLKSVFPTRKGDIQTELEPGNYTLQGYFNGEKVGEALSVTIKPGANNADVPLGDLKVGAEEKKDEEKKDDKKPEEKKGG
ncbi:MAG: hypothetical protein U0414_37450 [Polyangiaceae bacterium]